MQNIGIYQLAKIINLHTHTNPHGERDNIHNNNKSIIAVKIQFVNQIHTPNKLIINGASNPCYSTAMQRWNDIRLPKNHHTKQLKNMKIFQIKMI